VIVGLVLALIVAGALVVRPIFPALFYPSWQLVGWELDQVGGFDPTKAQTTTVVWVGVWVHGTPPVPLDASYLDPIITYTPWSVTITLRDPRAVDCTPLPCVGGYTMPVPYPVQLGEPLGARALFDGSAFPPAARPYP
jgi:hypothetical protein